MWRQRTKVGQIRVIHILSRLCTSVLCTQKPYRRVGGILNSEDTDVVIDGADFSEDTGTQTDFRPFRERVFIGAMQKALALMKANKDSGKQDKVYKIQRLRY